MVTARSASTWHGAAAAQAGPGRGHHDRHQLVTGNVAELCEQREESGTEESAATGCHRPAARSKIQATPTSSGRATRARGAARYRYLDVARPLPPSLRARAALGPPARAERRDGGTLTRFLYKRTKRRDHELT